ncbi:conserved hypothetical protein [Acidovorax delafieldii 2AN]|uniref:Deaminase n=1 Tax=Acidovorax delafieldii 2AN TaxID=573060 RepID=C5T385_ACIDE|nr:PP0621 family protein [Acidovorax delafieldii]EER61049.1 conserved hypothetical protein [Acidovorax delafieldii 2AN]
MKYLVLMVVLAVVIGIWRSGRSTGPDARRENAKPRTPGAPQAMATCHHCGVHFPRSEALMLGDQAYCCAEHRRQNGA